MRTIRWCAALGLSYALLYAAACSKGSAPNARPDSAADSLSESKTGAGSAPAAASPAGGDRKRVLFVGTSLTAGLGLQPDSAYPMLIQRKIDSAGLPFEVTNAGVSGETSAGLLDRLAWLLRGNFSVLVLETGANDGLRGIPVATLRANLDSAVARIKRARPQAKIVLVQMEALPNLGPRYASEFHNAYPAVARENGVVLVPFLLTDVAGHRELNQGDGIHPNDRGEHIVADNLWKHLQPVLEAAARP